mgnify:CR=1 FL=1
MFRATSHFAALPKENQVAALSTLLGQWAIQAGGKLTTNLEAFVKALDQANDPANYDGSMMREFIIKADTPEAVGGRRIVRQHPGNLPKAGNLVYHFTDLCRCGCVVGA